MNIGYYIQLAQESENDLARAFRYVAETHKAEPDIFATCNMLAGWSEQLDIQLLAMSEKYGTENTSEADRLLHAFFDRKREGSLALLQNLQDLWLMASEANVSAIVLGQAAAGLRDATLMTLCADIEQRAKRQTAWLLTRIKSSAPQSLIAV